MLRQIFLIVGIGAILTAGTQPAIAQRVQRSSDGIFDAIEGRSYEENPEFFFPKISSAESPFFSEGSIGISTDENSFEFEAFGEDIILGTGEFLADEYPDIDPDPLVNSGPGSFGDISEDEEVWLLIELDE